MIKIILLQVWVVVFSKDNINDCFTKKAEIEKNLI